jgi:nitroimidazol reductase NimA-like FMN-containing flavoprotein (pyridoxamine 5'-phosphate oxidase superfamily)
MEPARMDAYAPSARSRVKRLHKRAHYDRKSVYRVLDATFVCHVAYVIEGQPYQTPTSFWREGDRLYWHGSSASRMLRTVKGGVPVCFNAILIDGLVLARSGFHSSVNYRSVTAFGSAAAIADADAKLAALKAFSDRLLPGRWEEMRAPTAQELKATTVVTMEIEEAVAKVRGGPPADDDEDYALSVWAGVVPFRTEILDPVPDPRLAAGTPLPAYLEGFAGFDREG